MHFIKVKQHLGLSAGCGKKPPHPSFNLNLSSTDGQAKYKQCKTFFFFFLNNYYVVNYSFNTECDKNKKKEVPLTGERVGAHAALESRASWSFTK